MEIKKDLRPIVAIIFLPGLYLCLLVSALLSIAVAGILIAILFRVFSYTHFLPSKIMILIAIGGFLGLFFSIRGGWRAIQKIKIPCSAVNVTREHAPLLFEMINELCLKMRTAIPDNIILELASNFFVTEAKVRTFDGEHKSRTLCLSAPMLHILSPAELKAIIVHELAHFTGEDTAYSKYFYPIYRGTLSALRDMDDVDRAESDYSAWMSVALIVPKWMLRAYLALFTKIERGIGRQRELRADALAATEVTSKVKASALVKAHVYGTLWDQAAEKWIVDKLNDGMVYKNISALFAETFLPEKALLQEGAEKLSAHLTHPTDSHPCLKDRLTELGESNIDVFNTEGETAATLFSDLNPLEERLTEYVTSLIAEYHPKIERGKSQAAKTAIN